MTYTVFRSIEEFDTPKSVAPTEKALVHHNAGNRPMMTTEQVRSNDIELSALCLLNWK